MTPTIHSHKAGRDYLILHTYEAGIELKGPEVKSLRAARANIDDAFARVERGQVFLYNAHIAPYEFANRSNTDPHRPRRLLLHKHEINKLFGLVSIKGHALIPLKIYFKKGHAKIELAIAKGRTQHDKRETIKRKMAEREMDRAIADKRKHRG